MNLFDRAKKMLTTPKTEWEVVAAEQPDSGKIITGYALPFIILGAVAAFIGYGLIGFGVGIYTISGTEWGLYYALNQAIVGICSILITTFVVDALAPSFNSEKNFPRSLQLVVYGSTPGLVAGLFAIIPILAGIVAIAGAVYSVYLWYLGLGPIKKTPEDKKVAYMIICFVVLVVVYILLGYLIARLLLPAFGLGLI